MWFAGSSSWRLLQRNTCAILYYSVGFWLFFSFQFLFSHISILIVTYYYDPLSLLLFFIAISTSASFFVKCCLNKCLYFLQAPLASLMFRNLSRQSGDTVLWLNVLSDLYSLWMLLLILSYFYIRHLFMSVCPERKIPPLSEICSF